MMLLSAPKRPRNRINSSSPRWALARGPHKPPHEPNRGRKADRTLSVHEIGGASGARDHAGTSGTSGTSGGWRSFPVSR